MNLLLRQKIDSIEKLLAENGCKVRLISGMQLFLIKKATVQRDTLQDLADAR